jgi:hypothetical protein
MRRYRRETEIIPSLANGVTVETAISDLT